MPNQTPVGYVNTSPEDPSFGQPIYRDASGNHYYMKPGYSAGGVMYQSPTAVYTGQKPPSFMSATPPSASAAQTGTQTTNTGATGTTPSPAALTPEQQAAMQANQQQLNTLLADPNLTADQKAALQAVYDAISTNDQSQADRIKAAVDAATQYSDPYFKAQTRMVLDSLDRGFQAIDDDLQYKESSLARTLESLQRDIASSKDYLSFQQIQEMRALERNYEQAITTTREDMAARGFTSSSIRSRREQLIGDTYGDLRESSQRSFLEQERQLTNQLSDFQTNAQAEVARLQQLAAQGKLDASRVAEEQAGTTALQDAGYTNLLGGVGGQIPRQQVIDAQSFASQFVF